MPEKHFDLVTAVSGSGPAYFFLLMEQLVGIGRRKGLSKEIAETLAVQTAVGAGQLARHAAVSPGELRRMVTSKKGTTEAALSYLSKRKFEQIFSKAVDQAIQRAKAMSR